MPAETPAERAARLARREGVLDYLAGLTVVVLVLGGLYALVWLALVAFGVPS